MRLTRYLLALVCVGALLCAWPALAQEQTGSIQGTVKDSSGAVLPGVTVEAKSPQMVGAATAVTDGQGIYRFPALPPGTYTITATLQGFTPGKVDSATLALGQLLSVNVTLSVGTVSETVQVKGEAPLIDTKQNATFSTIQQEAIDRIPKGRDFQTILKTAPGAQDESKAGGTQVDGASGTENRFILDGMDTTNPSNGLSGKTLLLDFIQEVQVKSSGYNAEFGGATGGVVSAITKSGSNAIRGQFGSYYQTNKGGFIGDIRKFNRYDPYDSNKTTKNYQIPDQPYSRWEPLGDIGGPIFKDKLWYWVGADYTKVNNHEDVTFYSDPKRVQRSFDWWSNNKYVNYNLTTQLTNNMRLKFAGQNQRNGNRKTAPGLQPIGYTFPDGTVATTPYSTATQKWNADGSINQDDYNTRWVKSGSNSLNDVYSGNLDWVVTSRLFVNVSTGYYKSNSWSPDEFRGNAIRHVFGSANADSTMTTAGFPTVPSQYQQVNGFSDNISSFGTVRDLYTRSFVNANTTFFKSGWGQHVFKAGTRFERFTNDVLNGNAYPVITFYWGQKAKNDAGVDMAGKYGYYVVNQTGTIGQVESNNWAFWLQDSWTVNSKLTLNYGARFENETIPSYKKAADALVIKFPFSDKIAPRAGFAYDVKGDGKWKAYGSYGWYYTITPLNLARGSFGGDHWVDYQWTLDTPDWASVNCKEGNTGCPGTFISSVDFRHSSNQVDQDLSAYFNRPNMTGIDPAIRPPQTGEFTSGLDHELSPIMSIGVAYKHKWMTRTIEDMGIFYRGAEIWLIGNPGENYGVNMEPAYPQFVTPGPRRNYDSVEVTLKRRLSNNWSGQISYMWSRLYGNYTGLASGDEQGRTDSPNATRYWDNTVQSYDKHAQIVYGLLPTDRPHVVKAQGTYDFKTGTSLGGFWIIETGIPQTTVMRMGGTVTTSGYPIFINDRGDLGRSPMLSQLDLVATQSVKFNRFRGLLQLNIDNVFDQDKWTSLFTVRNYGPEMYRDNLNLVMPSAQLFAPNGYDPAAMAASYKGTLRPNAFYQTPNVFQGRRQLRLSFKLMF